MNLGIDGKRAVVSGSTAGIGFATAQLLGAEGAQVVVNVRWHVYHPEPLPRSSPLWRADNLC